MVTAETKACLADTACSAIAAAKSSASCVDPSGAAVCVPMHVRGSDHNCPSNCYCESDPALASTANNWICGTVTIMPDDNYVRVDGYNYMSRSQAATTSQQRRTESIWPRSMKTRWVVPSGVVNAHPNRVRTTPRARMEWRSLSIAWRPRHALLLHVRARTQARTRWRIKRPSTRAAGNLSSQPRASTSACALLERICRAAD